MPPVLLVPAVSLTSSMRMTSATAWTQAISGALTRATKPSMARRAATGNRLGGQALKDIALYNQDAASQEYGNAYNRYTTNQNNIYNRLSSLAGTGQTAGQAAANAGSQAAGNIGSNTMAGVGASNNYLTGGAAANAAGMVGSTNALVGGANNAMNNYTTMMYLKGNGGGTPGLSGKWNPISGKFDG
jgi:hypothetical protein